ncbi:MAG: hypothetical protein ACRD5G_12305, partial [Candidatus Acidiferrales bacterium]
MKVSLKICFCAGLFLVSAQLSEAQDLMAQVAEDLSTRIANAGDRRIIVDAKLRCDSKKCAAFAVQVPELIKNALMRSSAPPEIVSQAELERLLRQQGFQPIDYYFSGALRPISRQIKAFFLTGSM